MAIEIDQNIDVVCEFMTIPQKKACRTYRRTIFELLVAFFVDKTKAYTTIQDYL